MKYKILFTLLTYILLSVPVTAQQLTAHAPQQVAVGEQFRLSYTATTQDVSGFRVGQIPDAFEVLMGPSTSSQSSFSMVNGKTSHSSTITYTYILSAEKTGTFTIPAASINIDGKQVKSNIVKIQVVGAAQSNSRGNGRQGETRAAGSNISGSDLFIKVTASKQHVVEQEPILLTYKVYTLVRLSQLEGKMPDLKGFHTQEIPLPQEKSFKIEQYNGRNYKTVTWSQYVMFPQITGKLEVPSIIFNGIVVQENRNVDPFEAFFNGGSGYVEVKKQIKAPGITIQVYPLPSKPNGFSGGVGTFNVKSEIDKTELKANDPLTIKVVVSGVGNLKLIKQPELKFPKDFDTYDPKLTEKTHLTSNGHEGEVVYEYLAVPRHQGKFDIPGIDFTYYDTKTRQYKTLTTEAFHLNVAKGDGNDSEYQDYTNQEDLQVLGSDIHHIKLGNTELQPKDQSFFASERYWLSIAFLMIIFIALFIIFRKRAIENADLVKLRGKKANKIATKRLKKAAKLMKANQPNQFFDEVLRALWGYVGDKMNIPVEQLSRDNISECFNERKVEQKIINQFVEAIDECEFERYAPGDSKGNMEKVYKSAMTAIEHIEKHLLAILLLFLLPLGSYAITKSEADSSYINGNYQLAAHQYEQILKDGVSAEIYYNLGNSYYRMDEYTSALIAYERALRLAPSDVDIKFNLHMVRSKTIDKIAPESQLFFVTWYQSIVNLMSANGWAKTSLYCLALTIVLLLLYLFSNPLWIRKFGFFSGLVTLFICILAIIFAWQQQRIMSTHDEAIIIESAVPIKSSPSHGGKDLFLLHEGTKVKITDDTMTEWKEIIISDGKKGWIEADKIEII